MVGPCMVYRQFGIVCRLDQSQVLIHHTSLSRRAWRCRERIYSKFILVSMSLKLAFVPKRFPFPFEKFFTRGANLHFAVSEQYQWHSAGYLTASVASSVFMFETSSHRERHCGRGVRMICWHCQRSSYTRLYSPLRLSARSGWAGTTAPRHRGVWVARTIFFGVIQWFFFDFFWLI